MKVRLLVLVVLLPAIMFLIACGGNKDGGTNPAAVTPAPEYGVVRGSIEGDGPLEGIPVFLVAVDSDVVATPNGDVSSIRPAITAQPGQFFSQLSGPNGTFDFQNVPVGTFNLFAQADRYTGAMMQNVIVKAAVTAPVELKLRLTPTGQIAGTVSLPNNFSKSGVVAFVKGTSFSAFTDDEGKYLIYGVPVGTYSVGFNAAGLKQSVVSSVAVAPAQVTTLPLLSMTIDAGYFDPRSPFGAEIASQYATLFATPVNYNAESASNPVLFSHYTHVSLAKQNCFDCHNDAANGWAKILATTASAPTGVKKTTLFMKQIYEGKFCGTCHNGARAFDAKTNCTKCHAGLTSNGPEVPFKTTKVVFSHKAHVDSFKMTCNQCHQNNNPWPMAYKDKAHTMAEIWAGKGCGICHKTGGVAFACGEGSCKRCHPADHAVVNPGEIGSDSCVVCHAEIVKEYQTPNIPSVPGVHTAHSYFFFDPAGTHAPSSNQDYSCMECHAHEAVFGKAFAMSVPTNRAHTITCQTCHHPTTADGGNTHAYRLRKDPDELCGTCHHMRYTYGDNPVTTLNVGKPNSWSVLPQADRGFPILLPISNITASITSPVAPTVEITKWAANTKTLLTTASNTAEYAFYNLIYRGQMSGTVKNPRGSSYSHYSPQYDIFRGKTGKTTVQFTHDLKGTTLVYNDSYPYNKDNACVVCHMQRDPAKGTFGHTFVGTEEGAKKVYGAAFDMVAEEKAVEALVAKLVDRLDVNDDGKAAWASSRNNGDADLVAATAKGLSPATLLIMQGIGWNYIMTHEDGSEGVHNPEYVKSLLNNCITIMDQLKDPALSSDSAKITWF